MQGSLRKAVSHAQGIPPTAVSKPHQNRFLKPMAKWVGQEEPGLQAVSGMEACMDSPPSLGLESPRSGVNHACTAAGAPAAAHPVFKRLLMKLMSLTKPLDANTLSWPPRRNSREKKKMFKKM